MQIGFIYILFTYLFIFCFCIKILEDTQQYIDNRGENHI